MLIDLILLVKDPVIIQGLLNGTLKRFGSVIREAGTGRIVRHLAEAPGLTNKLMTLPFSPVLGGASLVTDVIGHGITIHKLNGVQQTLSQVQQTLSSVLNLSQIAAGASVLNLGVSLAGFAYMGYKLHQVQQSIDNLQKSVEAGFDRIDKRLDKLSGQLAYLHLLVEHSLDQQRHLGQAISELHRALLIKEIAELQAELTNRTRFPDDSPRDALKVASRCRIFLANQAIQAIPGLEAQAMLITDVAVQGWAVATATECNLLLEIGQVREARELLSVEVPRFQQLTTRWADELLECDRSQLSTAYRFTAPRFQPYISAERSDRIANISSADSALSPDKIRRRKKDVEVEFEMSYASQLDEKWTHRQIAVAEYLDSLSELSARLEGLQAFAELCDRRGVKSSREILPANDAKPGLYVLPAGEAI